MAAPVGPKKVPRYTLEFKIQAVKLANHPEIQTQDVAHALDIHPFMLSKWKKLPDHPFNPTCAIGRAHAGYRHVR